MEQYEDSGKEKRASEFLDKIKKADGELIPLNGKQTKLNEQIFISARYGEVDSLSNADHLLLVDVFAGNPDELKPIGHYDWEISGEQALGNKNRHGGHLPANNRAQEIADKTWNTGEAFKVYDKSLVSYAMETGGFEYMNQLRDTGIVTDEEQWQEPVYQKQGIGSLMISVSAVILEDKGITNANLGSLSAKAVGVWKNFGVGESTVINVEELVQQERSQQTINEFV